MTGKSMPILDPLTIPSAMSIYGATMSRIAACVFAALFVIALLDDQVNMAGGEDGGMRRILRRAIIVFCGLALYRHIFLKIVALNEIISMCLLNLEEFAKFRTLLLAHLEQQTVSLLRMNIATAVTMLFLFGAAIAETLLQYFRYIILAILYVIGPLAVVCAMLPKAFSLTKAWFTTLLQVSFWVIVLRAAQAVMLSIGLEQVLNNGEIMGYLFVSVLITAMTFFTPLISERLLSGANISLMGGMAMMAGSAVMGKIAMHPVTKGAAVSIGSAARAAYNGAARHKWADTLNNVLRRPAGVNDGQTAKKQPPRR